MGGFPRKLYKCNRCLSTEVAWWKFENGWKLIPATLDATLGRERGWRTEVASPVWCDPSKRHETECARREGALPPGLPPGLPAQDAPAQADEMNGGLGEEYKELPIPPKRRARPSPPEEGEPEEEKGEKVEEEKGNPFQPLVDAITKKVAAAIEPRLVATEKAAKDAVKEAKGGVEIHTVEWVPQPGAPPRDLGLQHKEFARLLFWVGMGETVYLCGPPGGGKTEGARMVANVLERPFGLISLNPGTPESRLLGFKDVNGIYHPTPYRECCEKGGVFCIDEMDNSSPAMLTTINSHTNGLCAFPDGVIERHKDFVLIATGNTSGRGGTLNHTDRRALDAATMDRFVVLNWDYDEGLEDACVKAILTDDTKRAAWLTWVREARKFCAANHPRIMVSPRAAMKGAKAIMYDKKLKLSRVVEEVVFKGVEANTVKAILSAVPLPTL